MDKITCGTTGAGYLALLFGKLSMADWCSIAGVILTAVGIGWGIYSSNRNFKLQSFEANKRVQALEDTIASLLKERK